MSTVIELLDEINFSYIDKGEHIQFTCINPAHEDKHPSMTMFKDSGYAKCWACGATYKFKDFYKEVTGNSLTSDQWSVSSFVGSLSRNQVRSLPNRKLKKVQYSQTGGALLDPFISSQVKSFLSSISISEEVIKKFEIKWASEVRISFSIDTAAKKTYIKNRICIPIYYKGELVNMECRDFTGKPEFEGKRYVKVLYPKGSLSDVLFNYDNLDREAQLIVVEGIKSALRLYSLGYTNVTATLGSAIGNNQKEQLNEFKDILLFPDNDNAGRSMITQFEEFYNYDYKITFMKHEGLDPADGTVKDVKEVIESPITSTRYRLQEDTLDKDFFKNKELTWSN